MKSLLKNNTTVLIALCLVLVILPFFFSQFIPCTDLPQHLAQIRLLQTALENPSQSEYEIHWIGANTLIYYLLGFNWLLFSPIVAGKITVIELAILWIISIYALARHSQQNIYPVIIGCLFIFNHSLYWGFLNFLMGFPIFTLWYIFIISPKKKFSFLLTIVLTIIISSLLFLAHTLWLMSAFISLLMVVTRKKRSIIQIAMRLIGLIPIGIYSIIWFPQLEKIRTTIGFDTKAHWVYSPIERLNPKWIIDGILGGLKGPIEAIVLLIILIWIFLSIKTNLKDIRRQINKDFIWICIVLAFIVFFAPDKYVNTIYFASRWAPIAMIFLLLSLPIPRFSKIHLTTYALLPLVIISFATSYIWYKFDLEENSGLRESLNRITKKAGVIGLDFVQESKFICGRPFLQTFAYSQVLHGGNLNFSFAEHHSGIVSYKEIRKIKWTPGLEWFARRVNSSDFKEFDFALINATEQLHNILSEKSEIRPLTNRGRWRLYGCVKERAD